MCTSSKAHAVYTPAELHTAMVIGLHINDKEPGAFPWPSISTIVRETGSWRSTVIRHLNALCSEPHPLFRRHVTPGKRTCYEPQTSTFSATSTSTSDAPSTSTHSETTPVPSAQQTSTHSATDQYLQRDPNSVEQSRTLSEGAREDALAGFERVWSKYPAQARQARDTALRVWIDRGLEAHAAAVAAWLTYRRAHEWEERGPRYVPAIARFLQEVEPRETPPRQDAAGDWQNPEARRQWSESGTAIASMAEAAARQQGLGGRVDWLEETRLMLASWRPREPLEADVDLAKIIVDVFADEVAEGAAV